MLTFHDFPAEHRAHLRSTDPIGSMFAGAGRPAGPAPVVAA
ncbi:hypothetical protein ACGF13_35960 [Kitasatospora sp. NPDC048286]